MGKRLFSLLVWVPALILGCTTAQRGLEKPALETVPQVDIRRYLGTWYEIARYPNRFQKDCMATRVEYSLRDDGKIKVVNRCRKGSPEGESDSITGKAWAVDPASAKLKVQFFWPFSGDYWIIQLDPEYRWAVVGHPERKHLWILSRTPSVEAETLAAIEKRLVAQGYDPSKLLKTQH